MTSLLDDDLDEEEAIREIKKKNLENIVEDETLEIDKIVNIKESRNRPLENIREGPVTAFVHQEDNEVKNYQNSSLELKNDVPLSCYDPSVMTLLVAQLERKPRRDHGMRRGRQSTSSSSAFDQPSSSHLNG
ncbi:hypothetical protein Tco_0045585 [Tanacetum coccineum]